MPSMASSTEIGKSRDLDLLDRATSIPTSVYVWGPPGVGKSHAAKEALRTNGIKAENIYQVTLSEDLTVQELIGHFVPAGDRFEFNYGPITKALMQGALIINEIQRASASVQDYLLGVLDSEEVRQIDMPHGEQIKGHAGFRCIATSNSGPAELDEALTDRFDAFINVQYPSQKLVERLNRQMKGLGDFIRQSFDEPSEAISPRRAIAFLKLKERVDSEKDAAELAFGDRASDALMVMRAQR